MSLVGGPATNSRSCPTSPTEGAESAPQTDTIKSNLSPKFGLILRVFALLGGRGKGGGVYNGWYQSRWICNVKEYNRKRKKWGLKCHALSIFFSCCFCLFLIPFLNNDNNNNHIVFLGIFFLVFSKIHFEVFIWFFVCFCLFLDFNWKKGWEKHDPVKTIITFFCLFLCLFDGKLRVEKHTHAHTHPHTHTHSHTHKASIGKNDDFFSKRETEQNHWNRHRSRDIIHIHIITFKEKMSTESKKK